MHLALILTTIILAYCLRSPYTYAWLMGKPALAPLPTRANLLIVLFLFPPLLLLTTTLAILCMGTRGMMAGGVEGWWSYWLSLAVWLGAGLTLGKLAIAGWQTLLHTRRHPLVHLGDRPARLVAHPGLFSGQIGFWEPELVITQGLLDRLTPEQLQAVLAHEQAHYYYRDTFWFFWLGWLRSLTPWLPQTEFLWQELLLLREIRADAQAGQGVDPLVLAESLLLVVSQPFNQPFSGDNDLCAAFSLPMPQPRLHRRIDALLAPTPPEFRLHRWFWVGIIFGFIPLLLVPFHS